MPTDRDGVVSEKRRGLDWRMTSRAMSLSFGFSRRTKRIKAEGEGYYHAISRIVAREMRMEEAEDKDRFVALMRRVEEFSAVEVLTFAVLDNHFHILVDPKSPALRNTAVYIDLNAFRAKIVDDPSKYRWCGYGEACGGEKKSVEGLRHVLSLSVDGHANTGFTALRDYAVWLGGQTTKEVVFPERVCRFTNGLALGTEEYVSEVKARTGLIRESPVLVRMPSGSGTVCALRRPRLVTA